MTEDYEALERKKRELFPTMHGNHFVKKFVLEEKKRAKRRMLHGVSRNKIKQRELSYYDM